MRGVLKKLALDEQVSNNLLREIVTIVVKCALFICEDFRGEFLADFKLGLNSQ